MNKTLVTQIIYTTHWVEHFIGFMYISLIKENSNITRQDDIK